ncbi:MULTISPECIES: hypothetical protein [Mycolicibacterium]|uniref:Uncharacterized protein n=1 Tax=Mycolicibacterium novocastrense TaxID=59813 RepID=A0AAW5SSA4_MYCNV|nr:MULTISPECIES: hypothetical protein [Mycolicibacterium]MCV7027149.1 hypothetical protein [Mycolicibacterium novocastrense]MCV7058566.1 hypothetical protein [Mycolicibacterium gilvum]
MAERGAVVAVAVLMLAACGTAPPPRAPIAMPDIDRGRVGPRTALAPPLLHVDAG